MEQIGPSNGIQTHLLRLSYQAHILFGSIKSKSRGILDIAEQDRQCKLSCYSSQLTTKITLDTELLGPGG